MYLYLSPWRPRSPNFRICRSAPGGPIECAVSGHVLLNNPIFNRGSAHSMEERREFELTGLLPQSIHTLEQQVSHAYEQYRAKPDDLAKNTFLTSLNDQNYILYYKLLQDHIKEMFSVVYTPTEGEAIQNYSRLFRRPAGCFLNIKDIDRVEHDMGQWGRPRRHRLHRHGEEILGIGDQGTGGILISNAKLVLTTLCAGIHPDRTLPVVLDCGTDNQELLDDELYLGLRQKRVRGAEYDKFVDTFVQSARKLFPRAYIHFEDFGLTNARRILDNYRPKIPCFNDDVQGTGCVTLAGIMAGLHVGKKHIKDLTMVVFGAGTAGVGIADMVRDTIASEKKISKEEAAKQIYLIDRPGLLTAQTTGPVVRAEDKVQPNVLVGTSTQPGAFTEEIVRAMAAGCERPVILPLSNPTRLHEAVPEDLLKWTDGKALVSTGSPFPPVKGPWGPGGKEITVEPAECNNSVVFPGIGLGAVLSRSKLVTDEMLVAAVRGVAEMSPALKDDTAPLLPGVEHVRPVSVRIAREVILAAVKDGVATEKEIPTDTEELDQWIREQMWDPVYRPLKRVQSRGATRRAKAELKVVGSLPGGEHRGN
ncbi:hypothetical protein PG991_010208 [Apiospora marii]|uniref:Malic enzyme n=1 Tax=Apiospora marii TaxID=335849 RepID=A0ABR1RI81_9PEZI